MRPIVIALLFAAAHCAARDVKQVRAFRVDNPCPATGHALGACPGWVVDHMIPLCAGGADEPFNMHWQKREDSLLKDVQERKLCERLKACNAK